MARVSGPGRRLPADLGERVLVAAPAAAVTVALVAAGDMWFVAGVGVVGAAALAELARALGGVRPVRAAGAVALAALLLSAFYGGREALLAALIASLPLAFLLALPRREQRGAALSIAATLLGILWIGGGLSHGVLLRELPHGGGLVIDVLLGTFIGDTAAHLAGTALGRRPLAPRVSPAKTVEGAVAGVAGGTLAVWLTAVLFQDWLGSLEALALGAAVALAAPAGDLFESLVKRDLGIKDTGRLFGAHGGMLDRIDAVLFSAIAGYYVSLVLL